MDGRASQNPLECLQIDTGPSQKRAALEPDELRKLLAYCETADVSFGLTGHERATVYQIAAETGLRASEIDALRVKDFNFKDGLVQLSGQYTKNRLDAELPLKKSTMKKLKKFFKGKGGDEKAFRLPYISNCARMIRKDLDKAGIKIEKERGTLGLCTIETGDGIIVGG